MRSNTGILSTRYLSITKRKRSTAAFLGHFARELEKAWLEYGLGTRGRCSVGSPSVLTEELNIPDHKRLKRHKYMQRAFLCRIWAAKDKKCFGDSLWNKAGGGDGVCGLDSRPVSILTSWLGGCGAETVLVLGKQTLGYFEVMNNPTWSSLSNDSEQR